MASVIKRSNKYAVVYTYTDENGVKKQKWETYDTRKTAMKRKAEVELHQLDGTLIVPTTLTVRNFLQEFIENYGQNKWALSTYSARKSLIANYVDPHIGKMPIKDLNTRAIDQYYKKLLFSKAAPMPGQPERNITPRTVIEVHRILRCAFNQAVRWEYIAKNPALHATLPRHEPETREIWTADELFQAVSLCEEPLLSLCMHLAFACSVRIGEILGLTWDCVQIDDEKLAINDASIFIDKELARVNRDALQSLEQRDVLRIIPPLIPGGGATSVVLKKPKTKSSVRRVWLPATVAKMLLSAKEEQEVHKELLGVEYQDYNLVIAQANGRPVEEHIIAKMFKTLIAANGLRPVVFHSLRHTSTTYKLKLNQGDIKSVQGDTGHSQVNMVTDVYSHIIDEDRRRNAARFEAAFYTPEQKSNDGGDVQKLLGLLQENPNLVSVLSQLLGQNAK